MTSYTMKYRPVATCTLPRGITYDLIAMPQDFYRGLRPLLPQSSHRYGEFTTSRPLTADELRDFEIIKL